MLINYKREIYALAHLNLSTDCASRQTSKLLTPCIRIRGAFCDDALYKLTFTFTPGCTASFQFSHTKQCWRNSNGAILKWKLNIEWV